MKKILSGLHKDWSLSASVAGFVAVLISYSGPLIIFFQAAQKANISHEMMASWIWAISIGAAIPGIFLSIKFKVPIITAWSAPGTALLVSLFPDITLSEVIAGYLVSAVLMLVVALSGTFDYLLRCIPQGIAAGMMAGILFQFGVGAFNAVEVLPLICISMFVVYILAKRFQPKYCMLWVLLSGLSLSISAGIIQPLVINFAISEPIWITPAWHWSAIFNFALPLFLVNLSGQFLPGMALFKLNHYQVSTKPILTMTSLSSMAVACFGGINIVLASITASLCMGEHCHPDASKRYIAGISNGLFYLLGGMFATSIVAIFSMLPKALVACLAGLALLAAISQNLSTALDNKDHAEAALICFLCTASGMNLLGISAVVWGIVFAMLAFFLQRIYKNGILSLVQQDK